MRIPALAKGLGAVALAGLLSACGSIGGSNFSPAAIFYGGSVPPEAPRPEEEFECPAVEIREGAAAFRFGGGETVRAQAVIAEVARECRLDGDRIRIAVGVEGRVMLAAGGTPGSYQVPVRIVMKRGDTVVAARSERLNVVVPQNDSLASFVSVQRDFLVPKAGPELTISAGLDTGSDVVAPAPKKKR